MRLSDHDLLQLTEEELLDLPEEVLRRLSVKLLYDLKEARWKMKQATDGNRANNLEHLATEVNKS
jgi:hypothetical protein